MNLLYPEMLSVIEGHVITNCSVQLNIKIANPVVIHLTMKDMRCPILRNGQKNILSGCLVGDRWWQQVSKHAENFFLSKENHEIQLPSVNEQTCILVFTE